MSLPHSLLHALHHTLLVAASLLRRVFGSLWMVTPPAFCRDWQGGPPVVPADTLAPPSASPPIDAVTGGLLGMLVAAAIPARDIVPILPRGVVFPPGTDLDAPYPISIAFGLQHHVGLARFPTLPGADYLEFAVGVSNLRLVEPVNGFSGPCAILGRLDLDELLPIVLGRLLGLQKVLRLTKTVDNAFGLRSFWRRSTVAYGSMHRLDAPRRASDVAGLAPLIATFDQPVVSRSMFGTLAFTRFHWAWHDGLAQAVTCDLTIKEGLGAGRYVLPSTKDQPSTVTGAWQIRVPWTMEPFHRP